MRDAITLASDGWEVDWPLSLAFSQCYDRLSPHEATRAILFRANGAPLRSATGLEPADRLVQRDLAASLRAIASDGPGVLYGGALGQAIADDVQRHGGLLAADDFASFAVR